MREQVLVLEDEVFVALDLEYTLGEAGYRVAGPFGTVQEALELLRDRLPDCAVLDVQLRDGEVYPAADVLRDAGVPIVFHSGHADTPLLALAYPQALVCSKPSAPGELVDAVARARNDAAPRHAGKAGAHRPTGQWRARAGWSREQDSASLHHHGGNGP